MKFGIPDVLVLASHAMVYGHWKSGKQLEAM